MKIEAGKRYVRRDGSVVTIELAEYPFYDDDSGESYTPEGMYYSDGEETDFDLVSEYVEPPTLEERYGEPEPGWRWLADNEQVEEGDEFDNNGKFVPTGNHRLHRRQDESAKPYRRRVKLELKHGGTYRTRDGSCVTVERRSEGDHIVFPFKSWQDTYTSDGRTHLGGPHEHDIVEVLDEDTRLMPKKVEPQEIVTLHECLCRYENNWQIEWMSDTTLRGVQKYKDLTDGTMVSVYHPDEVLPTGLTRLFDLAALRRRK